ncbi:potassium transporter TrkG [Cytophagaceae bacterium ABcell3]|nr:potassium transporter TrkG [Cytophagaceae bacterium ABcell3]
MANWKENLNTQLYESKRDVYYILRVFSVIISVIAFALTMTRYGFYLSEDEVSLIHTAWIILLLCFLFAYLFRILYSFHRRDFLRRTWFEGSLMLTNLAYFILLLLGFNLIDKGLESYVALFIIFLSVFEFVKISPRINLIKIQPTTIFIASFLLLITVGTCILMLPTVTTVEGSMPFIDALFTAVSASCVTGLIVVDTGTYFTLKGHILLLILFQLGGLSIISFATFFSTLFPKSVGIKHQSIIKNIYSSESLVSAQKLFKQIVLITIFIEALITAAIFFTWGPEVEFKGTGQKIFYSLFHAVAAFCNSGFSLYTDGLYTEFIRDAYILHIVIALAIIFGGIGFPVIQDVLSIKKMRERLKYPWKDWTTGSKVAIYTSIALLIFGTATVWLIESNNTLKEMNLMQAFIASFFQSVTARSAGFNTIDTSALQVQTHLILIFLMFVGASPASTGGGIKTTTFLLIVVSSLATIKESTHIEIGKRTIPNELISKAFSLFTFAVAFNFIGILVLSFTEQGASLMTVIFEQISAFTTTGLSAGLTPELTPPGKLMIIISMFSGRVGILTVALALSRKVSTTSYRYPDTHIMIG